MPLIDKPLEELKIYQGRNPRPTDFEAYWDAALKELEHTEPRPVLEPRYCAHSGVECFHLWFDGVFGARIHAKYVRPKEAPAHGGKCPAVLRFHGYTGSSGDWVEAFGYAGAGMAVASMDCRGQGGLSEDDGQVKGNTHHGHIIRGLSDPDPRKLLFRQIFLDTVQLARVVISFNEIDKQRVASMGASQGGGLALACAALEPRISRVATCHPFLSDYRRVWEMDLARDAFAELSSFFRHFDPLHEREEEIFAKLGYIDIQHLAPRIEAHVLMACGLMDTVVPPSTQFAAYNKIPGPKQVLIYPDFRHEGLPGWQDRAFEFLFGMMV